MTKTKNKNDEILQQTKHEDIELCVNNIFSWNEKSRIDGLTTHLLIYMLYIYTKIKYPISLNDIVYYQYDCTTRKKKKQEEN